MTTRMRTMMKMLGFIDEDDECGGGGGGEVNDVAYGFVLVPKSFGNRGGGGKGKGEERNDMVLREREREKWRRGSLRVVYINVGLVRNGAEVKERDACLVL